jgi:type IV pilus assembly protein PilM
MAAPIPPHFSIDFGNNTLKLVYITRRGGGWDLRSIASVQTPPGTLNSYKDEHKQQLIDSIKELVVDSRVPIKEVAVALPESAVFSRVLTVPKVGDNELTDAVYWQLKQFLPYPIEEVQSDFTELMTDPTGQKKILAVAAPKKLVQLYVEILEKAGLVPVAIESETLSILRAIKGNHNIADGIVLDFGAQSTDMAVMLGGELFFSQSISTGSDLLTKALVNEFQLSYAQAEEYKRAYGINPTVADGKIYNILKPVIDMIVTEVLRGLEFYKGEIGKVPPSTVFICGEAALLPALPEYLKSVLGSEVYIADPWKTVSVPGGMAEVVKKSAPGFCVSVGLCMKEE